MMDMTGAVSTCSRLLRSLPSKSSSRLQSWLKESSQQRRWTISMWSLCLTKWRWQLHNLTLTSHWLYQGGECFSRLVTRLPNLFPTMLRLDFCLTECKKCSVSGKMQLKVQVGSLVSKSQTLRSSLNVRNYAMIFQVPPKKNTKFCPITFYTYVCTTK